MELLQSNISNLAETLAEVDALPPVPPGEESPGPPGAAERGGGATGPAEAPASPAAGAEAPAPPSSPDRRPPAAGGEAGGGAHAAGDAEHGGAATGAGAVQGGGPLARGAVADDDTAPQLCNGHAVPNKANFRSIAQLRQHAITGCRDGIVKQRRTHHLFPTHKL